LQGRALALCAAGSGLAEQLQTWLPAWGLDYQRLDEDASPAGQQADLLICDSPERLNALRQQCATPLLLVSAYGAFIPSAQASQLAPFEQLARPLARAALQQTLQRLLRVLPLRSEGPPEQAQRPLHQARVLLVEDNQVNQMVAKGMLTKLGCEVAVTAHGGEAIAYLERHEVDMVLMDCNMPVMDGYEATRRIRQSGRWPNLPIIALTANALPDERERCQAAGMNDYLAKPFRREDLASLLDNWLPLTSES
jgi:CheY-like chemotaxis protein